MSVAWGCRPEDAADVEPLGALLFGEGQFPVLDGTDTLKVAKQAAVEALEGARERLAVAGDEEMAARLPRVGQTAAPGALPPACMCR